MAETNPTTEIETAADRWPDALEEHLAKPWAMFVRVEGPTTYGDGEPTGGSGELMLRLVNVESHSYPKSMEGTPPINLAIAFPWGPFKERGNMVALGGILLTARAAKALGEALLRAAEISE